VAYDILIKSGLVLDGTDSAPALVDIGIKEGKIAAIGKLDKEKAPVDINAFGKYIAPGFIDITNHSDTHLTIFKYPDLSSLIMQGITTIIGGNCGASLAPLVSREAINAIRKWVDPSEININWIEVKEFLEEVAKLRLGVNFGTFIGYGTLRRGIIGDETRLLNFEEREKIKLLLQNSIEQGAYGFSLGLSYGHERISTTEEIIEIAKALQKAGGIFKIHLRSEGKEILAAVNEVVRIGRETGVPIQISHLKAIGKKAWSSLPKALELISSARFSGVDINFDVSPYNTTGSLLYLLIPAWARSGGFTTLFKNIDSPTERKKIIEALRGQTIHFDKILIISAKMNSIVGKTLKEVIERSGLSPEEAMLEMIRANEGRVTIVGKTVSRKNTELEIKDADSIVASDGVGYNQEELKSGNLVHPRSFGAFPHFWHHFVNDLKLLSPQKAICKITSAPAEKLGIKKRGSIKKGNYADLVVFDPQLMRERATYKNPFRYPAGIEWVIINGQVAVEQGKYLGTRAGIVLKKK